MRHPSPHLPRAGLLTLALAFSLAACKQPAPEPPAAPPEPQAPAQPTVEPVEAPAHPDAADGSEPAPADAMMASCDASAVASLVGQEATGDLVEQARSQSGANSVRVLKPRDAATMDYRGDRLNILTDDAGIVQAFNCG